MNRFTNFVLALAGFSLTPGCLNFKDADGDGYAFDGEDCDDSSASVHPGALELMNGGDDDCDGLVDNDTSLSDDDGDGFAEVDGDCNDVRTDIHPGAVEVADGDDQDCNGLIDEGTSTVDDDSDGYTEFEGDCDDENSRTYPGAEEVCGDLVDNDCTGAIDDLDADEDGFVSSECEGTDCDDDDPAVFPRSGVCTDGRLGDDVLAAVVETGSAEVCLSLPHNAMTDLPLGNSLRQAAVAAQQEALTAVVGESEFAVTHRFSNVNAICGVLTLEGAIALGTDTSVASAWLPQDVEAHDEEGDALIGADDLKATGFSGWGVTIAVIDSGVDYTHPDLGGCYGPDCRVVGGYDFVNEDEDPTDDNGHGTAVAGIIGSSGDTTGIVGVAPGVELVSLKVFDAAGHGDSADVLAALNWVADHADEYGIRVVNYSGGSGGRYDADCTGDDTTDTIDALAEAGVLVVISSGNGGQYDGISYPSCAPDALAVGQVYDATLGGSVSWSACSAPEQPILGNVVCSSNSGASLDLLAPGYAADTLALGGGDYFSAESRYFSGTSAAAPYAAAAGALLFSVDPTATLDDVRALLLGATTLTDSRNGLAFPMLDVVAAAGGLTHLDADRDGYESEATGGTDCDDADPTIHPGAFTTCVSEDRNCDDVLDGEDGDRDGVRGCDGDCDDGDDSVGPSALEAFDGVDNDCSGYIDDDTDAWPSGCELNWFEGSAFLYCTSPQYSWEDAQAACDYYGYHLAVLNDASEWIFVDYWASYYSAGGSFWIGLNDIAVEGRYVWESDNSEPTYPLDQVDAAATDYTLWPWHSGMPDSYGGNEDCIEMDDDGSMEWNDESCGDSNRWLCEAGDGR